MDELTNELFTFFNGFASWESSVIKASDLTVAEAHAISVLGKHGQMNMKTLAQHLGVTTGTTTVTVDRLERKEYAKRVPIKEDRRVNLISLTEKGDRAFQEHIHYHDDLTRQILSSLSECEAQQLHLILQKINKQIF